MAISNTIVVIGGGIGGLATALALLKRGLDVDVYEQSARLGEVGAGIQISSNGTHVLYSLALERPSAAFRSIRCGRKFATGVPVKAGIGTTSARPPPCATVLPMFCSTVAPGQSSGDKSRSRGRLGS